MKNIFKIGFLSLAIMLIITGCGDEPFDVADGGELYANINPPASLNFLYQQTSDITIDFDKAEQNATTIASVEVTKVLNIADFDDDPDTSDPVKSSPVTYTVTGDSFSQTLAELFADAPINGNVLTEDDLDPGDSWSFSYILNVTGPSPTPEAVLNTPRTSQLVFSCPLDADFTGEYNIVDVTGSSAGGGATLFGAGPITLEEVSTFVRSFEATYLPSFGIGNQAQTFQFRLECQRVLFSDNQNSGLQCVSGISFGSADVPSSFDPTDDSVLEITLTEDVNGDCGPAAQTTIRLVKI
ncbi:hypothetical protein [Fulvivirga lutimaris]|uniref:hypothetical protein n=1 Tax=Fulvivirga lutimaris TaxID=1819566 RepID=UPI0012BBD1E5|nr:hypothetical protein [Fulvivirga lutimaris]MTI40811.1 hypothetical protein [Fulvivirga lutimaris]